MVQQSAWRDHTGCHFNTGEANGTVCPHFFVFSVGFLRLSLTFSSFFLPQGTCPESLDGPNPIWNINIDQPELAVCPNFWLKLLSVGHVFIECWSCAPSLRFSRGLFFFVYRGLGSNEFTGTIPAQISVLVKLDYLWALASVIFSGVFTSFLFSGGWIIPAFSFSMSDNTSTSWHMITKFCFSQRPRFKWLGGIHPASNVNVDQADSAVCPKRECFIECWSHALLSVGLARLSLMFSKFFCAAVSITIPWRVQLRHKCQHWPSWHSCMPHVWFNLLSVGHMSYWVLALCASLSHIVSFFFRLIYGNGLTGTIPAQISVLVELGLMWVLTSFLFSVGLSISAC